MMEVTKGTLYVVATPIGNLGDITLRAIDTLRAVDRVVAEDTRRTRGLLSHLGIQGKPLEAIEAHATERQIARVVERLREGEAVALVTDAGMPSVSDPGTMLVRAAIEAGISVTVVPGPSAVTTAVAISALVTGPFFFMGFLPRGGSLRREALARLVGCAEPVVVFEAPGRVKGTLEDLAALVPERKVAVARELSKLHEEVVRGTLGGLAAMEREWIGEVTLVVGPDERAEERERIDESEIDARIDRELAAGVSARDAADRVAAWSGRPRREIYAKVLTRKG